MKYQDKESGVYGSEYRLLTRAKEILTGTSLTKDELFNEYAKIVEAYENLLKKFYRQDRGGDNLSPGKIFEMQSHLLSGLSYQFRTPLTLIITSLEQMFSRCRRDAQKKNWH